MVITRIGPLSLAKITGAVYALIGLLIGAMFSLASLGGVMGQTPAQAGITAFFGVAAIIVLPIFYGCLGFVSSLFVAWLYNLFAGAVGGIDIDIQP